MDERRFADILTGAVSPDEILDSIVAELHSTGEPDAELCREVGCGDLESLIMRHGEILWPRIETLAREDLRFRRALRSVWAYDSPEFDRRDALLEELGEFRTVTVRFVAEPPTFDDAEGFTWRALQVEPDLNSVRLAGLLRSIAAHLDPEGAAPAPHQPADPPLRHCDSALTQASVPECHPWRAV